MIQVSKYLDNVYVLQDRAMSNAILVIGKKRALLFDTGCGMDNIKETVESITDLPLLVILSHGHFDHIAGSCQFDCAYLAKEDQIILEEYDDELINTWLNELSEKSIHFKSNGWKQIKDIDFDTFDLGDCIGKIIQLSGHTKGSIGIYFPSLKILLAADALSSVMCMMFLNHTSLEEQLDTLYKVQKLDIDAFITSHSPTWFNKSLIDRMILCIQNCKGKRVHPYQYPKPPHVNGYIYVDSIEDEPVGLIVESKDMING